MVCTIAVNDEQAEQLVKMKAGVEEPSGKVLLDSMFQHSIETIQSALKISKEEMDQATK